MLKLSSSMMRKSGRYDLSDFALNNALRFGLDEDRAVIQVFFYFFVVICLGKFDCKGFRFHQSSYDASRTC